ncbi:MAG: dipeptidase [Dorea sp.]|nr:dipeptidase [Dorea sp.]
MKNLIDFHCDTIWNLGDLGGKGNLYHNDGQVSIEHMLKGGTKAQCMAFFTDGGESMNAPKGTDPRSLKPGQKEYDACYAHVLSKMDYLDGQIRQFGKYVAQATSYEELEKNAAEDKISLIYTVEESGILSNDLSRLDTLYARGVRLMTPMWNYENCLGYPNHKDPLENEKGLKAFGIEAIQKMDELGIILDVAHASDGCFWDILKYSEGPVLASHSNCRALCHHSRNLTDEMIRALAERGGVSGLNLFGWFLNNNGPREGKIKDMVRHIHHMINKGGIEFPAIGTDFDGIGAQTNPAIANVGDMPKLWGALVNSGLSEDDVEKIWHKNAERVIQGIS